MFAQKTNENEKVSKTRLIPLVKMSEYKEIHFDFNENRLDQICKRNFIDRLIAESMTI